MAAAVATAVVKTRKELTNNSPKQRCLERLSKLSSLPLSSLIAPIDDEEAASSWCWILNYGIGQTSKIHSLTDLPCSADAEELVGLLAKPYALVRYSSASTARTAAASDAASSTKPKSSSKAFLAQAHTTAVAQTLASLTSRAPPPPTATVPISLYPNPIDPSSSSSATVYTNGLTLYTEFVSPAEEAYILDRITSSPDWGGPGRRKTLHFGPHFDYTTFAVSDRFSPVPDWLTFYLPRLAALNIGRVSNESCRSEEEDDDGEEEEEEEEEGGGKGRVMPDQFTVQYYPPGTGIPPHVDTHSAFEEELWSLSLGATVPMTLRRCGAREARRMRLPKRSLGEATPTPEEEKEDQEEKEGEGEGETEEWDLVLPPRSLLLMTGAGRYGYSHGIAPRKMDQVGRRVVQRQGRWSVTMRGVKRPAGCECMWGEVCDAQIRREREREGEGD